MNKMKKTQNLLYSLPAYLLSTIASVLTIAQAALAFFLRGQPSPTIEWAGWICLWVSAIFGILPIITFRAKGGVPQGQSYMKTTQLVDTGIYAIVRHPQGGTAWLLINLACHAGRMALDQRDARPGFHGAGIRGHLQSRPGLHPEIR